MEPGWLCRIGPLVLLSKVLGKLSTTTSRVETEKQKQGCASHKHF